MFLFVPCVHGPLSSHRATNSELFRIQCTRYMELWRRPFFNEGLSVAKPLIRIFVGKQDLGLDTMKKPCNKVPKDSGHCAVVTAAHKT